MAKSEFANMTPEERRENGRKGGLASVKARREKKAMKDNLASLLSMSLKSGKIADVDTIKNFAALNGKNVTVQDAILIKQVQKALSSNTPIISMYSLIPDNRMRAFKKVAARVGFTEERINSVLENEKRKA